MRRFIFAVIISSLASTSWADSESWKGSYYELGSNRTKLLFEAEIHNEVAGGKATKSHTVFKDPEGKVAATEEVSFNDGKLSFYKMDQKQTGEWGSLEVKDGKVLFVYNKDGKTSTDDEKFTDNLIIAPTTVSFVLKHWAQIMKGDTVDARYAALDRKETVGFKFFKIGEDKLGGQDVVTVKMKPSSIIIAALVDPLIFTFDKAGTRLLVLKGRTLPKRKVDSQWKDLDTEAVFQY